MHFLLCLHAALFIALSGAEEDQLRIVGGYEVAPHSRPYMASLQDGTLHMCGGALIREDFVLTAAHCKNFRDYRVVVGIHSLTAEEPHRQEFTVRRLFPHEKYQYVNNDIMLIQLNGKVNLSSHVQLITPMTQGHLRPGKKCIISGWGDIGDNNTYPDTLHEVKTTIIKKKTCDEQYSRIPISSKMVCATGQRAHQGFCTADSGGPLVCNDVVAGVVSFSGQKCGNPNVPDVYTRVASYKRWIAKILKEN